MSDHKLISVVVPVYNEELAVGRFFDTLVPILHETAGASDVPLKFEVVMVDDGSTDATVQTIRALRPSVPVRLIRLSRNFGKESAMTAGLAQAQGDAVVLIDVDLQDPPELIPRMVAEWLAGAPVVLTRRSDRSSDTLAKRVNARMFYRLHNAISNTRIPENVPDFRLMDRQVVDAVNALPENRRFMKGLFAWVGFEPVVIDFVRAPRSAGKSKFSGWKLWRFAIEGITSFSIAPLVMFTYIGIFVAVVAFIYGGAIILRTLAFGADVPGYASTLTVVLFLGGIQILGIGILGEYLGRVYSESKRRPPYVIARVHELVPDGDEGNADGTPDA